MYDKWILNMNIIEPNGFAGECPYCGGSTTHASVTAFGNDRGTGAVTMWCDDCKKAFAGHFRHKDYPPQKGIPVPSDLIY